MEVEAFETFLLQNLPSSLSFHPHYSDALSLMLKGGGKRFRPALLLSVVKAYNPLLVKNAYLPALAIELLHTYSLIHDDLPAMDNAPLRRGLPTLHVQYDDVTAILVGDALNTYAFEVLSNAPLSGEVVVKLIRSLAYNGGVNGMVLGQALDCHFENQRLNLEEIKFLHIHKTGKLIAAALEMGAIIIGEDALSKQLYDFGINLGLLFQIQDDILDVTQSDEIAGKTTQNDEHKNSFVTLLGLDEALKEADALAQKVKETLESFDENLYRELSPTLNQYIYRHKD